MKPKLRIWNSIFVILLCALIFTLSSRQLASAAHPAEENRQAATTGVTEVVGVVTSTPRPDGTVIHIVEYGQTLYDIALSYGVSIEYLKGLNYLSNSNIYVGEKLVIQPASTLTPVGSATATLTSTPAPTRTPRPTAKPTRTPAPTQPPATPTPTSAPAPVGVGLSLAGVDPILIGIFGIGFSGVVLMVIGVILRKKS